MAEKLAENYEKGKNSQPLIRFKNSDLRLTGGGPSIYNRYSPWPGQLLYWMRPLEKAANPRDP